MASVVVFIDPEGLRRVSVVEKPAIVKMPVRRRSRNRPEAIIRTGLSSHACGALLKACGGWQQAAKAIYVVDKRNPIAIEGTGVTAAFASLNPQKHAGTARYKQLGGRAGAQVTFAQKSKI